MPIFLAASCYGVRLCAAALIVCCAPKGPRKEACEFFFLPSSLRVVGVRTVSPFPNEERKEVLAVCVSLPRRLFQQPQRNRVLVDGGSAMLATYERSSLPDYYFIIDKINPSSPGTRLVGPGS